MIEPSSRHRSIRIPTLLRIVTGEAAVVGVLADLLGESPCRLLVVHSGGLSATGYGARIARDLAAAADGVGECVVAPGAERTPMNTRTVVEAVLACIDRDAPRFVVAVGGGRVVDVAKLAAAERGVDLISVPTQAASDGICSPVAVLIGGDGRPMSLGARIPAGIIVDMDVLDRAAPATWRSGLGDLVSNLSAVLDWRLAHDTVGEEIDDFACLTAEAAAWSVIQEGADLADPVYRQVLIRGLILSGIAMEMAGSSRPASGSEHLISHALDIHLARPRPHGLQVALGTVAAFVLRGDPWHRLIAFHRSVGLPVVPADLGISDEEFLAAIEHGPSTRPGRWTVLDQVGPDDVRRLRGVYDAQREGL